MQPNDLRPQSRWSSLRWFGWATLGVVVVAGALLIRQQLVAVSTETVTTSRARFGTPGGTLVIAGGGALPASIPQRFVELAGGSRGRLVVLPAAPLDDQRVSDSLQHWSQFGLEQVDLLQSDSRTQSDDPAFSSPLLKATAVWLSGGQQTWLTAWYRDTLIHRRIVQLLQRGGVVGGTSAGASAISDLMIAGGRGDHPLLGRGFGFLPETVIDQHFLKRNRLPRLMAAVRRRPGWIGFGIDEGTAIVVRPSDGDFQVIGQSYVVACSSGDVATGEVTPGPAPAGELRLQSFSPGDEFDLERLRRGELLHRSASSLESLLLGD